MMHEYDAYLSNLERTSGAPVYCGACAFYSTRLLTLTGSPSMLLHDCHHPQARQTVARFDGVRTVWVSADARNHNNQCADFAPARSVWRRNLRYAPMRTVFPWVMLGALTLLMGLLYSSIPLR